VIELKGVPAILIVDEDVGFLWWLGELFHEAGYQSIPALSCREALSLARDVKGGVDLVLVHPGLRGVSHLIQALRSMHAIKVILLQENAGETIPGLHAEAIIERPTRDEHLSRQEWRQTISRMLRQIGFREAS
jgi:DNA-binding response OmpR family regulator